MTTYAPNQLHSVPLAELQPDPTQPRKYLDPLALEELMASISQVGIIEPVVCRQDLNAVEEAEALKRLMDKHAYPQDQLARIIGKSQATISLSLSLNKFPQEIRDECRQDPTVPRNVLVTIARKKQDRSMVTEFKKYRAQQANLAARQTAAATPRKRTKAETLTSQIGVMQDKFGDLDLLSFAQGDRDMVMEAMSSLRERPK